jgi:hypothetical protein
MPREREVLAAVSAPSSSSGRDVVRSRMMQTGRSLNRPRRASHDGAHNGGTPPPPTTTTTATTSSTTTTRACSGPHFLDIDALCYSSIYVFRRPPAIAHKLLMYERENKKSKEELKEALQKLEAAQFLLDEKEKDALQQLLDNLEQVSNIVNAAGKVAIEKSETDRVRISNIVNDGKVAIMKCVSESSRINYTILILLGVGLLAQKYLLNVATLQSVREKALKTEPTYLSALTSILKGGLAAICDLARDSKSFNEALKLLQFSVKDDQCDEGGDVCDTKVEIRGMKLIIKRMTVEMLEVLEALYRRTKHDGTVHGSCGQIVKRIDRTSAQLMLIKLQRPALIIIQACSKCIKHSEIFEEVFNNWYATLHNLETDVDQTRWQKSAG